MPRGIYNRGAKDAVVNGEASLPALVAAKPSKQFDLINPDAPFGIISGDLEGFPDARYTQNGRLYDTDGALIKNAPVEQPNPQAELLRKKLLRKKADEDAKERAAVAFVPGSTASMAAPDRAPPPNPAAVALKARMGKRSNESFEQVSE